MNCLNAVGRIGRDAVTRFTQAGKPVTGWALAVDSGFGDNKQTTWIDCNAWGEKYQKVGEYIRKGDRIGVTGEIGTREHNGKTYITLNVSSVTLLGEKRDSTAAPAPRPPQKAADSFDDDPEIPF